MKITASAPTRIDLAGGTIDLWPIHHLIDHKATVNVAITCSANVEITETGTEIFEFSSEDLKISLQGKYQQLCEHPQLPLFSLMLRHFWTQPTKGIKIKTFAKSPAGAGLGGSSCLAIAIGAALQSAQKINDPSFEIDEIKLVRTAQNIEARLIHTPTGCQDYWSAVRGSINLITYPYSGEQIETLNAKNISDELNQTLISCYSGKSRASAINNWEIFKGLIEGDESLKSSFNQIGQLAEKCGEALKNGNLSDALEFSHQEWLLRKKLWPNIETPETREIDNAAKNQGAYFTRVCGAGGGGVMAVFAPPEKKLKVCEALTKAGGTILDAQVAHQGLIIRQEAD